MVPDRIRNRWLTAAPEGPQVVPSEPSKPDTRASEELALPGELAEPPKRVFVTIQDLPDADLLGQPSVPETVEEPEAEPPAPKPRKRSTKK